MMVITVVPSPEWTKYFLNALKASLAGEFWKALQYWNDIDLLCRVYFLQIFIQTILFSTNSCPFRLSWYRNKALKMAFELDQLFLSQIPDYHFLKLYCMQWDCIQTQRKMCLYHSFSWFPLTESKYTWFILRTKNILQRTQMIILVDSHSAFICFRFSGVDHIFSNIIFHLFVVACKQPPVSRYKHGAKFVHAVLAP